MKTLLISLITSLVVLCVVHCIPTEQKGPKKLSDQPHTHKDGEHNVQYDHEAFLGKEQAAEFDNLPLEESKRRLRIICDKIDTNSDGYLTREELKTWVAYVSRRHITDNVKMQFPATDKDGNGKISWEEYKKATFGEVIDPDAIHDARRGLTFKMSIARDEKRFKVCDKDKDGLINEEEYMAFVHPEEFEHTRDIYIEEAFEDMDKNRDGSISLDEYIEDIWPSLDRGDGETEPEWVKDERVHFSEHRDTDGDHKLNKRELGDWISPQDYDAADAEASHLIHHADSDKDEKLSIAEVIDNHSLFVGSHATEFGGYLKRHDEF